MAATCACDERCHTSGRRCYSRGMPTTRPRHAITETSEVAHALDVARRRWPGQPASRLLTHLIEVGGRVVEAEDAGAKEERERAVSALTALSPLYPPGYLDEVRDGWPA